MALTLRSRWGDRIWFVLDTEDRLVVDVPFYNASLVTPPHGLEVARVGFGHIYSIHYVATKPLAFHSDLLYPDPDGNVAQAELKAFNDYRQQILDGQVGAGHRRAIRAQVVGLRSSHQ